MRDVIQSQFLRLQAVALTLTGTVLVVVCMNISGMMQVRSAMRERELSIRQAIGAPSFALNGENMGIPLSNVEPLAYVVGAAIALLVAVLASLGPARRAASVQPMVAMRSV